MTTRTSRLRFALRSIARVAVVAPSPVVLAVLAVPTVLAVLSCAHLPAAEAGGLRVDSNLGDATVWIDDAPVGNASAWKAPGRQIHAGFHRIEIRHPGYYSVFQEIDLPVGGAAVVAAKLRETIE